MRIRPLVAAAAALLAVGGLAVPAGADPLDDLRRLIANTDTCVRTPVGGVKPDQICTGAVLEELGPIIVPPPVERRRRYAVVLRDAALVSVSRPSAESLQRYAASNPDIAATRARQMGATVDFVYRHALRGYAAWLTSSQYAAIAADPAVKYVAVERWGEIVVDQPNPTWGLDRIDQRNQPLDSNYHYHATGAGVTAYIVDTGIEYTHPDFAGRAIPGFDSTPSPNGAVDCNGHGTHVAGTVGGTEWGVAKHVQLVGIRVVNCGGSGSNIEYAAGVDWMTQDHQAGVPAVANASLHYWTVDPIVDDATNGAIADGIAFAVAAANDNADACLDSPSNVPDAMTVGATDVSDTRAWFSNWGACVDWFAPGVAIESDWIGGGTATLDGTSMASPHTAGVAAQLLQSDPTLTPTQVRDAIWNLTTKNIVVDAQSANEHLLYTEVLVHLPAVGTIELSRDSSGYSWDTTGVFDTDFVCALYTVGTVRVQCNPMPSPTVVWDCNFWLLDAWAPKAWPSAGTGTVKGSVKCDGPDTLETADINGYGTAHNNSTGLNMATAGTVVCRAAGIGTNALPTGSYKVLCNEPGVNKPFGPGYQSAGS